MSGVTHLAILDADQLRGLIALREVHTVSADSVFRDLVPQEMPPIVAPDAEVAAIQPLFLNAGCDAIGVVGTDGCFVGAVTQQSPAEACSSETAFLNKKPPPLPVFVDEDSARLKSVIDAVDALILVLDPDGRIVQVNQCCEAATGFSATELQGRNVWDDPIRVGDSRKMKAVIADLRETGSAQQLTGRCDCANGTERPIKWSAAILETSGAQRIVCTGTVLTDGHRTECDLGEADHRFRTVVESMTEGLALRDAVGKVTYVNPALCEMFACNQEDWIGVSVGA